MKQMKLALLGAVAAIALMTGSAQAASTTGSANATVIAPISVTAINTLDFAKISAPTSGTGHVFSNGAAPTGGALQFGAPVNGTFTVTGEPSQPYNNTGSDTSVTLSSGANSMTAALTYASSNSFALTGGTDTLTVSGDLTVAANQPAGAYTGTYNVVVNY